ncbi:MAG: 50S ribosomal protein L17 [Patescibacteria group bacterium]
MAVITQKFHRKKGMRQSFFKVLVGNLIMREKIITTETRAKAIRPIVERLVTLARRNRVEDLRLVISRLGTKKIAEKLFYEIAPRYKERKGGYTRIVKLDEVRKRDGVKKARIEFV